MRPGSTPGSRSTRAARASGRHSPPRPGGPAASGCRPAR
jgi:hypothetical protein